MKSTQPEAVAVGRKKSPSDGYKVDKLTTKTKKFDLLNIDKSANQIRKGKEAFLNPLNNKFSLLKADKEESQHKISWLKN